jgi:hypothetical protein
LADVTRRNPFILKAKRRELDQLRIGDEVEAVWKVDPAYSVKGQSTARHKGRITRISGWGIEIVDKDNVYMYSLYYMFSSVRKI